MIKSPEQWPTIHPLPFFEIELLANLTPQSAHADEIASLLPKEIEHWISPAEDKSPSGEARVDPRET
ncbi:hypothetical protein [Halomonas sp. KO116]|uniref:hypothetical protein n=1 Tax=Halomonas sp. KO116 TaxID=1504981 RepID=UPI0004E2938B|nr:hypothetical protein [Halomonas sp. KO116]AJY52399.1 hypothetical protein KO116_03934 [Halomonas sp. KO116]